MAVPRNFGQGKLQILGKIRGNVETARTERGHGADGAAKLQDETALLRFREAHAMAIDGVEPPGGLEAKRRG